MKVGVVCEGPTDFPAITNFFANSLQKRGITASFRAIYPEMDRTRPDGGWANVFSWAIRYPAAGRIQRFFSGGFFGGALTTDPLDAIVFQLDSDVLDHEVFKNFVFDRFSIEYLPSDDPSRRGEIIESILSRALQMDVLTDADNRRHVLVAAVESTEAWCVTAFRAQPSDCESLKGQALTNAFMNALELSESRIPQASYENADKSYHRRIAFCKMHASNSERIERDCPQYAAVIAKLESLASS